MHTLMPGLLPVQKLVCRLFVRIMPTSALARRNLFFLLQLQQVRGHALEAACARAAAC